MGAENFWVSGNSSVPPAEAHRCLLGMPGAAEVDPRPSRLKSVVRGDGYVFEIEIYRTEEGTEVAFSITVCHPMAALERFIALILDMVPTLQLWRLSVRSTLPDGVLGDFDEPPFVGFTEAVRRAFELKRNYWIADFGAEEAAVTAREAIDRFVIRSQ